MERLYVFLENFICLACSIDFIPYIIHISFYFNSIATFIPVLKKYIPLNQTQNKDWASLKLEFGLY